MTAVQMMRNLSGLGLLVMITACDTSTENIEYPEAGSPAAKLFLEKCSFCHVAPAPTAHAARVWPGVLQRMQMRMKAKGMPSLNNRTLADILDYLQRNAAELEPKK